MSELLNLADLAEKLLRQVSKSPGIEAYKPGPKQEQFHQSEAKEKLFIGGNRSGKTTGAVAEDVMWLTGKHRYRKTPEPPIRGRCVAVDIEDGIKKIVLPEVAKWTPPSFLKNGSWEDSYDKLSRTLTLNNGSFLEFFSYEQSTDKFAGTSRHFVHFDEEPPEEIFDENLMRLVDTDGSYWIAMTPLIEMTWVEERIFQPWLDGDRSIFVLEVDTDENPYINIEALTRLSRGLSEESKLTRRSGKFITHTGIIYDTDCFLDKPYYEGGNIVPDIVPYLLDFTRDMGHFTCMDHGLANPTVFLFCAYNNTGQIVVYDELYIAGKELRLIRDNARKYLEQLEALGVQPVYCVGDPNIQNRNPITGTSVQTEYAEHGVPIALGNNNVDAGIGRVQNLFGMKKLFISERCKHLLKERKSYRWDRYTSSKIASRRNLKEKPLKKNDHCLDALRYGCMSRPIVAGIEETPVGNVLGAPVAGAFEMDYELCFKSQEQVEW